jgi:hypothetical protein
MKMFGSQRFGFVNASWNLNQRHAVKPRSVPDESCNGKFWSVTQEAITKPSQALIPGTAMMIAAPAYARQDDDQRTLPIQAK